ncbi:MAG TPA: hypothetical protein P5243_06220 [Bacteroidales bacterium]|nr:hypothetical protein [Bacteroidales bacterium]
MGKHSNRTQLSARFTDKIREKFNEISEVNPEYTDGNIIEAIIDQTIGEGINVIAAQEKIEYLQTINDNLTQQIDAQQQEIDALIAQANTAKDGELESEQLQAELFKKNGMIADLEAKLQEMTNIANENARLLQAHTLEKENPKAGTYVVELPPFADEIMQITCNRLREKLQVPVSPNTLLTDLFVKYTVEQPADFAFPTVLNKTEIKVLISKYNG